MLFYYFFCKFDKCVSAFEMCKGPKSRCKTVNLRNPNVHFREVNTKTTFGKIQFGPTFITYCDSLSM